MVNPPLSESILHLLFQNSLSTSVRTTESRGRNRASFLAEPVEAIFNKLRTNSADFAGVRVFNVAVANWVGRSKISVPLDGALGQNASLFLSHDNANDVDVQVTTLKALLTQAAVSKEFLLLLIDTEGADLEVLQSADFDQFHPAVILTEDYQPKDTRRCPESVRVKLPQSAPPGLTYPSGSGGYAKSDIKGRA